MWILILYLSYGGSMYGGVTIETAEFNTYDACENAAVMVVDTFDSSIQTLCVPKE